MLKLAAEGLTFFNFELILKSKFLQIVVIHVLPFVDKPQLFDLLAHLVALAILLLQQN